MRPCPPAPGARFAAAAVVGLSIGFWAVWATHRHDAFGTFGFDFGIFDQGVWLLSRFHSPFVTIMGVHLFGDHTSFILLPLVPVYWVFPSAKVLIVAQAAAGGLAAAPLFLLARDKLRSEWLAVAVVVGFLANPALGWAGWEQFHPDIFEVPLALCALYFMTKHRWGWYFVSVIALLAVKEDVGLMTFVLGLYVARKHDRRVGLATAALSVVWFSLAVWAVLPLFNGQGTLDAWRVPYGGIGGLFKRTLTHPWDVVALAFRGDKKFYLWQLFSAVGLLALLAPTAALIAIGPLLSNVLSTFWYQYHLQYHYTTLIVPVLAFASVMALSHLRRHRVRVAGVALFVVAGLVTGWLWGPSQLARHRPPLGDASAAHVRPILRVLHKIPRNAPVAAQYSFVTHLDHRKEIYEFPTPWYARNWGDGKTYGQELPEAAHVQYIVLPSDGLAPRELLLLQHLATQEFHVFAQAPGVVVLERVAPAQKLTPDFSQQLRELSGGY